MTKAKPISSVFAQGFTSCFAPIPECVTPMGPMETYGPMEHLPPVDGVSGSRRGPQAQALQEIEVHVRKHVAAAIQRRCSSLITRDDETLMNELNLNCAMPNLNLPMKMSGDESSDTYSTENSIVDTSSSSYDGTCTQDGTITLNTVDENKKPELQCYSMYDEPFPTVTSVRSRFEYMRAHRKFAHPNQQDPPCDKSVNTADSLKADEAKNLGGAYHTPTLRSSLSQGPQPIISQQRRNELAKQILRRRATLSLASRSGMDP